VETSQLLAREKQWETRAGLGALIGGFLALAGFFLLQVSLSGGDANFEGLAEAHDKSSTIWLSGAMTLVGYLLLTGPLLYLFRAVQGRSERVRNQFIGLVFLGPILLGLAGLALAAGTQQAANTYLDGRADSTLTPKEARADCREEGKGKQLADCQGQKHEEDLASNAIHDSSIITTGQFMGFVGGLSLVVALFYTGLWSLRTGLLSRFWGSLGMAVGVAALIGLTPLALIWFLYLGFLLLGRVPGGKPPAWSAGEAVPWPTPGEKAAADLQGQPEELGEPVAEPAEPRRKRKQRD
jgi:hypothetical protein